MSKSRFTLRMYLDPEERTPVFPTTSAISAFALEINNRDMNPLARFKFIGELTLLCLEELEMKARGYPKVSFPGRGPHSSPSPRAQVDLLEHLADINSLETLAISDNDIREPLITDTLFIALTHTPLVPRFRSLRADPGTTSMTTSI
ncbi:hypothetical protein DFH09DRAFT_1365942 [Mycena vulgaris]|nr:hypothetical protein DFH09DRAFT_1365942 [Mycena vulgaris]